MTELESHETGIDGLLRRSMAEPIPALPSDFDQRLMREIRRASQPLDRNHRILLASYGVLSAVACAVIMRAQGLAWGHIAVMTLAPLALIPVLRMLRRAPHPPVPHSAD